MPEKVSMTGDAYKWLELIAESEPKTVTDAHAQIQILAAIAKNLLDRVTKLESEPGAFGE